MKHFRLYLLLLILFWTPTGITFAQDRILVGFEKSESLTSLSLNQDWQLKDMGKVFWQLVYDQLWIMGPAPNYDPLPSLATRWETNDNKTWRFFLNSESRFSDQIQVTAEDVIFSLDLFLKNKDGWNPRGIVIESTSIIDEHTVDITLMNPHSGPYPPFYRIPILPRHAWRKYQDRPETNPNRNPISSGPYLIKDFKPGEVMRLVKNHNYQGYTAQYDELVFMVFANTKTLYASLKSGLIDFLGYEGISPFQVREFDSSMGVKSVVTEGLDLQWLSFNLSRNTPIKKLAIRKALMTAIDKQEIIRQVYNGYAKELFSVVYPELTGYNPDIEKYSFDQDAASEMLSNAGYVDVNNDGIREDPISRQDLSFSLLVSKTYRNQIKIAEFLKRQFSRVGVRLNLMLVDSFVYNNFLHNPTESAHDMALVTSAPGPYEDWIWNMMKSDEDFYNQYNHSNYINYAFDRIYQRMLTTTDSNRKIKYLYLMQEILADDLPYGMLVRPYKICPVRQDRIDKVVLAMGGISSEINPWNYINPPEHLSAISISSGF